MKKRMWNIVSYIALLLISTIGISAFVFFAQRGESIGKWIPAVIFFGAFGFVAIVGIVDCCISE